MRALLPTLTLFGISQDLEVSTVALGYIYFEKLTMKVRGQCCACRPAQHRLNSGHVLQNVVAKENRKLVAAVCLLLAWKFNEGAMPLVRRKKRLHQLFEVSLSTSWGLALSQSRAVADR